MISGKRKTYSVAGRSRQLFCSQLGTSVCNGCHDCRAGVPWLSLISLAEQLIIIPPSPSVACTTASTPKLRCYQVIIVPQAATGFSPIKRPYPQIVSFSWPDRKADEALTGRVGDKADRKCDTYLSVFKQVMDTLLTPLHKPCVDLAEREEDYFHFSTVLKFRRPYHTSEEEEQGQPTPLSNFTSLDLTRS